METKTLKKCLGLLIDIFEKIAELVDAGNIKWGGLAFWILKKVRLIIFFVNNLKVAAQEWADLDTKEKADMKGWFVEEFDIANDELEAAIEEYFDKAMKYITVGNINEFLDFFKKFKKNK